VSLRPRTGLAFTPIIDLVYIPQPALIIYVYLYRQNKATVSATAMRRECRLINARGGLCHCVADNQQTVTVAGLSLTWRQEFDDN